MRNPGGYAVKTDPTGIYEWDSFTCFHCQQVVHVPARADPADLGGLCKMCMKLICPKCVNLGGCMPFEKKLEAYERAHRFHKAVGTVLAAILLFIARPVLAAELNLTWVDNSSDETSFDLQ